VSPKSLRVCVLQVGCSLLFFKAITSFIQNCYLESESFCYWMFGEGRAEELQRT